MPANKIDPKLGRTMDRRTWLDWVEKAAVISLGSAALLRCGPSGNPAQGKSDGGFDFGPGEGSAAVFQGWGERTVDEQDLSSILKSWKLTVNGMVSNPFSVTFADLLSLPRQDQVTDFHCVEGWSILDVPWNGVHLSKLFEQAELKPEASYVTFHTIGGAYNESLPLSVALEPKTMLGYGVAGSTLPLPHGFPVRLVVPRLLGYKNAKYVEQLELTDHKVFGYWVAAGYPYDGNVPARRLRPGKH